MAVGECAVFCSLEFIFVTYAYQAKDTWLTR